MEIQLVAPHQFSAKSPTPSADAISVTANTDGFTMFNGTTRSLGLAGELSDHYSQLVQASFKVGVIETCSPLLLIVPKAISASDIARLTYEMLALADSLNVKIIRFTHFAFIPHKLQSEHIKIILGVMLGQNSSISIETIFWEIDPRHHDEMNHALKLARTV